MKLSLLLSALGVFASCADGALIRKKAAVVVSEANCAIPDGYAFISGVTYDTYTLTLTHPPTSRDLASLAKACDGDSACVAIDTRARAKSFLVTDEAMKEPLDDLCQGLLVKKNVLTDAWLGGQIYMVENAGQLRGFCTIEPCPGGYDRFTGTKTGSSVTLTFPDKATWSGVLGGDSLTWGGAGQGSWFRAVMAPEPPLSKDTPLYVGGRADKNLILEENLDGSITGTYFYTDANGTPSTKGVSGLRQAGGSTLTVKVEGGSELSGYIAKGEVHLDDGETWTTQTTQ